MIKIRGGKSEIIELPRVVGSYFDPKSGRWIKTKTFEIRYSNKGVHVFPSSKKGKRV
jgi:hypothetical protein